MGEDDVPQVRATRAGGGAMFVLRVDGHAGVWHTRQFAFKPRRGEAHLVPYWFEPGRTWHLWAGQEPTEAPPLASFTSMEEVKVYVQGLVAPGGAGG